MELKTAKVLAAIATISSLLIVLPVLWRSLGLSRTFFLVAGISSAIILIILLWILAQYISTDQRRMLSLRKSAEEIQLEYSFLRRVAGLPTKFPLRVLEAATDNFRALIARGSSGSVFKGILDDGTVVAVKLINGVEHGDEEFQSEISVIASVQHVNLVRLLGYCFLPDGGPRYLVYEFVANGSLDNWIFPSKLQMNHKCLPWTLRYLAAIDVAKALAYLHHDCRARVLHLDVKPENILLTETFRAVVTDFGLSKLMKRDESRVVMTVRGTRGYLAPEWLLDHGVTEKSDVYSYGMVLFELVGGRRNVQLVQTGDSDEQKWSYFPRILAEKLKEGKVMEEVDERIVGEVDEKQVKNLVQVALWCVQEDAGPGQVWQELWICWREGWGLIHLQTLKWSLWMFFLLVILNLWLLMVAAAARVVAPMVAITAMAVNHRPRLCSGRRSSIQSDQIVRWQLLSFLGGSCR